MSPPSQLIPCPGGCGRSIHPRANECPQCGYRAERLGYEELLGSLTTVSSILVGFTLSAIVSLATAENDRIQGGCAIAAGICWIGSAILLLVVTVVAEIVRRQDAGGRISITDAEEDRIWQRCERLLKGFVLALTSTAAGVVLMAFHLSWWHGGIAVAVVVLSTLIIARVMW